MLCYCHFTAQYQIGTLHFHIRRVSSLFPLFIYTHISATLKEVRGSKRRTTNLNFFSPDGATLLGPLVVVILKVDSSHETFGSKLKQLSSRTVKKICCGEREASLPCQKSFLLLCRKIFQQKFFHRSKKC